MEKLLPEEIAMIELGIEPDPDSPMAKAQLKVLEIYERWRPLLITVAGIAELDRVEAFITEEMVHGFHQIRTMLMSAGIEADPKQESTEKMTDEERAALRSQREWPDLEDIDKALRIIDQLTEALAAAERRGAHFDEQCAANLARAEAAESEVARLTEALAAAERREQAAEQNVVWVRDQRDRAESELHVIRQVNEGLANSIKGLHKERIQLKTLASAAERDRDAANALLERWMHATAGSGYLELRRDTDKHLPHLSSQPAAPEYRCGSCRDTGKWSNGIDCPVCGQPAALPCVSGYVGAEGQCNDCGKHHAAPSRDVESRCAACDQRLDASSDRDSYHSALLASPTASEARVRELESELTDLRRSYSENTEKMILAEARVRELEAQVTNECSLRVQATDAAFALQSELAALRERVAKALEKANGRWCEWGERAESVRDAIEEALRGE